MKKTRAKQDGKVEVQFLDPLQVEWYDASGVYGETLHLSDLQNPLTILHEVGFFVRQDELHITLAAEYQDDPEGVTFRNISHIPKVNIRALRVLK